MLPIKKLSEAFAKYELAEGLYTPLFGLLEMIEKQLAINLCRRH